MREAAENSDLIDAEWRREEDSSLVSANCKVSNVKKCSLAILSLTDCFHLKDFPPCFISVTPPDRSVN